MADNVPGGQQADHSQVPTGTPSQNSNTAQGQLPTSGQQTPSFRSQAAEPQNPPTTSQPSAQEAARIAELERRLEEATQQAAKSKQLEERLNAIENEKLAEQGKYKELYEKEVEQRKKDLLTARRELARENLRNLAIAEGIIDPDIVDMIPAKSFQYDDETGRFTNVRDLVEQHKAAKPHLYKDASAQQAPTQTTMNPNPARPTTGHPGNAPEQVPPGKKDISKLSRQEYEMEKANYIRSLRGR